MQSLKRFDRILKMIDMKNDFHITSFSVARIVSDSLPNSDELPMFPHSSFSGWRVWEFFFSISLLGNKCSDWGAEDGDGASLTNTHSWSCDLQCFLWAFGNDRNLLTSGINEQQTLNSLLEEHSWLDAFGTHRESTNCTSIVVNTTLITRLNKQG